MLAGLTSADLASLLQGSAPVAILLPIGSVEPHGPHLPLLTDTLISEAAAQNAITKLEPRVKALVAPSISYGVTEYARGFAGAISIPAPLLRELLREIVKSLIEGGVAHICLINNHLEPEHDAAVRAAISDIEPARASVASPLTRRWARTLSDEFKSGACHAGQYETSIVLAHAPALVDDAARQKLEDLPISLSRKIREGARDFREMGLEQGYAGAPRRATPEEGQHLIDLLGTMIATEVLEALF